MTLGRETLVVDTVYGETLAAAVLAVGSTQTTIRVTPGRTVAITSDLTIPANIALVVDDGASIVLPTDVTLTANGPFVAGSNKVFYCTGTGKVVFGVGSVKEVNARWWGAGLGDVDDSPYIQAALLCLKNSGIKGLVYAPDGTYNFGSRVDFYKHTGWRGNGAGTILVPTGNNSVFGLAEDLWDDSADDNYYDLVSHCTIDASGNANNIDLIYTDYWINQKGFNRVDFIGNPSALQNALHFYHTSPVGGANGLYSIHIHDGSFVGFKDPNGACVWLEGTSGRYANHNLINWNRFEDYCVAVRGLGIGNTIRNNIVNRPDDPVLITGGGSNFRVIFTYGYSNRVYDNWMEGSGGDVVAYTETGWSTGAGVLDLPTTNVGVDLETQIADLSTASGATALKVAAVQVSGTQCTIAGDLTAYYNTGQKVWFFQGTDGWWSSTVSAASSYNAGTDKTTITIADSIFTANLETISPAGYQGYTFRPSLLSGNRQYLQNLVLGQLTFAQMPIGSGGVTVTPTTMTGYLSKQYVWTAGIVANGATVYQDCTLNGVSIGDALTKAAFTKLLPDGVELDCKIKQAHIIRVWMKNSSGSDYTPSGSVRVGVIKQ